MIADYQGASNIATALFTDFPRTKYLVVNGIPPHRPNRRLLLPLVVHRKHNISLPKISLWPGIVFSESQKCVSCFLEGLKKHSAGSESEELWRVEAVRGDYGSLSFVPAPLWLLFSLLSTSMRTNCILSSSADVDAGAGDVAASH